MSTTTDENKIVRFTADIPQEVARQVKATAAAAGKTKNEYVAAVFAAATNNTQQPEGSRQLA